MKIRVTCNYAIIEEVGIVKLYKICGIPYTFDELPKIIQDDPEVQLDAATTTSYTLEDLYRMSYYLIAEECHPLLFPMEDMIENFEEVPD